MNVNRITHNVQLKMFSLLLATMLFLVVNGDNQTAITLDFPVQYTLRDDIMMHGDVPHVLHVDLKGPWAGFRKFSNHALLPVHVDLHSAGPGFSKVRLAVEDVTPPMGLHVVAIRPSEIEVELVMQGR